MSILTQSQSKEQCEAVSFFSTVMHSTCSTHLVTDHDNPAVKFIVIHAIPKYNLLTQKHMPSNTRKQYPETFFEHKNLKICPLGVMMKNYGTYFKCHLIFENEQMKKQKSLPSRRVTTQRRGRSTLSISTLLKTWMKKPLPWDGGWGMGVAGGTYLLSTESQTYCKPLPCTKLFVDIKKLIYFWC